MGENYEQLDFNLMDTEDYIYKSHNLVESGYNFTLNEQRLTYLASKKLKPRYVKSNIKPSELKSLFAHETFKDLRIYVNKFKNEFNINSGNMYKVLEDTAKGLKKKEIHYLQNDGSFVEKSWVITSKYNKEGKYVELTFHPDLILDLLVLKRFSKMQYSSVKKFKTSYSFRIYELMQNGLYKGKRTFDIEDFRYKLGIFDDNKYKSYNDLKKRVITPSIQSINEYTELNIEFKEYRKGRKVGVIEFLISQKSLNSIKHNEDIDNIDSSQIKNMEDIIGIKLTAGQVAELTDLAIKSIKENKVDMGFYDYIKYQMNNVKIYARNKTDFNWYGGIRNAIKDNWKQNEISNINLNNIPNLSFNNFTPREYDYDSLEKALLGLDKSISIEDVTKKR